MECMLFMKKLAAEQLDKKQGEKYDIIVSWLRTRLSFEIMRSVHLCVRGSRVPFKKRDETDMLEDQRLDIYGEGIV